MSIRYDPLIARALAGEILGRWEGAPLGTLRMERARRVVELEFADGSRLVMLLHPLHGHVYALAPDAPPLDIGGKELRVRRLFLAGVEAPPDERALLLTFADRSGRPWHGLGIELQTQRWNAVHVSVVEASPDEAEISDTTGDDLGGEPAGPAEKWRIETALLSRDAGDRPLRRGALYTLPRSTRRAIDTPPSAREWAESIVDVPADEVRRTVLQTWAWASTLNVEWILEGGTEMSPTDTPHERFTDLRRTVDSHSVWLHTQGSRTQPYPHALDRSGREIGSGLLGAMGDLVTDAGGPEALLGQISVRDDSGEGTEVKQLAKKLQSRQKRHAKRLAALERQLDAAGPPDEPRAIGQLLLARKDQVRRGAANVTLEDFDGSVREITLDPARDVVANANRLFDEARRRERALERLPAEIAEARSRREDLEASLARLEESGPSEELWNVVGGKPLPPRKGKRARSAPETRLPYTRLMSSGGCEIRVGRGPKDNDDLTFRHSAPDDIWLHASQASGAHVVLRWGRKDENPPRRDLLEAATAAAVHSGARHSGTVPVIWTRRKHVRKPRKSPPGTVVPDRVKTLFVKPDETLIRSLRPDV